MGAYVQGVYVPVVGETGWGEEVSEFLTRQGQEVINVKAARFGATGDGSTDDSTAIQAAIDYDTGLGDGSFVPTIYFPHGRYRIGAPLHLRNGQRLLGEYGFFHGGTRGPTLMCTGANTHLFEINGAQGIILEGLQFEDKVSDSGAEPSDIAIFATGTGPNANWLIQKCRFQYFKKAIDLSTHLGQWLICSVQNTEFMNAPIDMRTTSFVNFNSFFRCNFQANVLVSANQVPAVDLSAPGSSDHQKNTFIDCRWESTRRQAIRIGETSYVSLRDCYFEDINRDSANNPRDGSQKLPAVDLVREFGQGVIHFTADNCFFIILNCVAIGSTNLTAGKQRWGRIHDCTSAILDLGIFSDVIHTGQPSPSLLTAGNTNRVEINDGRLKLDGLAVYTKAGSPEGSLTANVGSICMRSDGGAATSFYVKESGTGNTGWVGK